MVHHFDSIKEELYSCFTLDSLSGTQKRKPDARSSPVYELAECLFLAVTPKKLNHTFHVSMISFTSKYVWIV